MSQNTKRFFRFFVIAGALTALFYAVWLSVISCGNPEYLKDFRSSVSPDAVTYVQLGKNIWNEGVYSRSIGEPFVPDFKWTPTFPFLAGLADQLAGIRGILILNITLAFFTALLLARIAFFWTRSRSISCLMFIFPALDPLLWSVNLQVMSDIMFLFFLILGVYWTFPVLFPPEGLKKSEKNGSTASPEAVSSSEKNTAHETKQAWLTYAQSFGGGLAFSAAILTRPSGLYVPTVLTIAFFSAPLVRHFLRFFKTRKPHEASDPKVSLKELGVMFRRTGLLAVFLAGALGPVVGWMARNAEVFGKFALCGNQNIVMVYYSGGGAWQTALGCPLEEAQERIAQEYGLPPNVKCQNPEAFGLDQGKVDTQLAECKRSVLFRYPKALAFSSCVGVVKSFLAHETRTLYQIAGNEKTQTDDFSIWNSWIFIWSILFQGAILLLAFLAILRNGRSFLTFLGSDPGVGMALLGWSAYFLLTMMLSGIDCCARYRLPMMPVLYFLAAMQLAWIFTPRTGNPPASGNGN
ncbi:MAG: hypothetical protein J6J31_02800 [Thermoguttaceae bacterium]|nr:hypothetical protein [Thermoguttaceae bacterium]